MEASEFSLSLGRKKLALAIPKSHSDFSSRKLPGGPEGGSPGQEHPVGPTVAVAVARVRGCLRARRRLEEAAFGAVWPLRPEF